MAPTGVRARRAATVGRQPQTASPEPDTASRLQMFGSPAGHLKSVLMASVDTGSTVDVTMAVYPFTAPRQ